MAEEELLPVLGSQGRGREGGAAGTCMKAFPEKEASGASAWTARSFLPLISCSCSHGLSSMGSQRSKEPMMYLWEGKGREGQGT